MENTKTCKEFLNWLNMFESAFLETIAILRHCFFPDANLALEIFKI